MILGYNTAVINTNNYISDTSKYNTVAPEFDDDNAILDMIERATNE